MSKKKGAQTNTNMRSSSNKALSNVLHVPTYHLDARTWAKGVSNEAVFLLSQTPPGATKDDLIDALLDLKPFSSMGTRNLYPEEVYITLSHLSTDFQYS